jgi:hypothetical protein
MIVNSKGEAIRETKPDVSGKVLTVARDWKGLGSAISDAFGSRFQLPSGLFILAIGAAIVILGVLVYLGYIPTPWVN